jgi:hypothetical protein
MTAHLSNDCHPLSRRPRRAGRLLVLGALMLAAALLFAAPAGAAGPDWHLTLTPDANYFLPGPSDGQANYTIQAEYLGEAPTDNGEQIVVEDLMPAGLTAEAVQFYVPAFGTGFDISGFGLCPSNTECVYPGPFGGFLQPLTEGQRLIMQVKVGVPSGFEGSIEDVAKISGGGTQAAEATARNEVAADPPPGIHSLTAPVTDSSGNAYTQAGGHPYELTTEFNFSTKTLPQTGGWGESGITPVQDPKTISGELPPGMLGNPQGVPHCALADFFDHKCPISTVIGTVGIRAFGWSQGAFRVQTALWNLQPVGEYPGEIGFIFGFPFLLTAGVRDGSDYGVSVVNAGVPEVGLQRVRLTTWGVPADPAHDNLRGKTCSGGTTEKNDSFQKEREECENEQGFGEFNGGPAEVPPTPFLTMPTECSGNPLVFGGRVEWWETLSVSTAETTEPPVDGCNALSFAPSIEARPTTNLADAPSGLEFNLHVPQNEDPEGVSTPEVKEAVVRLPKGLSLNPASAQALTGCTESQAALHAEESQHCPDASKLGTAEVETPLLHEPLKGSLFLATPHKNPSGELLAGYLVVEGQGVRVKLPGSFHADRETGQITASFPQNPQLPFENLKLRLLEGARASLRTPAVCGAYETAASLTPFSAPESGLPAEPGATFETTAAENGGTCPKAAGEEPSAPRFLSGTETPQAGVYSPFTLRLARDDGSQELTKIETILPPGLVAKLAGVGECSDAALAAAAQKTGTAEKAQPSCPASTEVGVVDVGSGAGPTPLYVTGHAYLSGPYKGAPISLAIITPAVAGPFDLGTVAVRTALYVNPETTQIHAVSDSIPTILEGIPLDLRSVTLKMARPNFTLNPTSCEESAFTGSALSVLNVSAPLNQRFQVGGCPALAFKPKLALSLKGATKRTGHPAFKATLTMPSGGANIASAQVTLPRSELLDQGHIRTICTRVQFNANQCPAASIYGKARAITPLLDQPLEGPVYLRSSSHELPDLVAALNGQIDVVLDGHIDSVKGGIRNTFEAVPDAPVSKFVLEMQGGKKGLLQNSTNICKSRQRATVKFTGQNGKSQETSPLLRVRCPKHHKKHKRNHHRPALRQLRAAR